MQPAEEIEPGVTMPDEFPLLLLRYFRDLTQSQRLRVLVRLKLLPDSWAEPLNQAFERKLIDNLATANRLGELDEAITQIQASKP